MAPVVEAYQAMRGASFLVAVTFAAEIGDVRRFDTPRQLMSFLGLVPAESSTGDTIRRKGLTLAGNRRARRVPIEAAWTYRYPARVSNTLRARLEGLPKLVRDIAWKAQARLCARYRRLSARGKKLSASPGTSAAPAGRRGRIDTHQARRVGSPSVDGRQELDGFIEGLFGREEVLDLPKRSHRGLDELGQMRALFEAVMRLAEDDTKQPTDKGVEPTLRRMREMTKIAGHEAHAVVLACKCDKAAATPFDYAVWDLH
jgi:Transposase IS116/IS110/IS902 family